jgi:hypothetical protein
MPGVWYCIRRPAARDLCWHSLEIELLFSACKLYSLLEMPEGDGRAARLASEA